MDNFKKPSGYKNINSSIYIEKKNEDKDIKYIMDKILAQNIADSCSVS